MNKFATFSVIALLCGLIGMAYAQPVPAQPAPVAPVAPVAAPVVDEAVAPSGDVTKAEGDVAKAVGDPSWDELGEAGKTIISDWRALGVFGGLAAIAAFLTLLLNFTFIKTWLEKKDLLWVRAAIAAMLGGIGGMFGAVALGADWIPTAFPNAFIAGLGSGLAAVGGHQIVKGVLGKKKKIG